MDQKLEKFWELEECSGAPVFSGEDLECERHFVESTVVDSSNKFVVGLPTRNNVSDLADVEKMYRMVSVRESDRSLQRIFWRFDSSECLKEYQLNTVTYGTAPAAFLAVRPLHQVAHDNIRDYLKECQIILRDFYVDDLITGAPSIEEAKALKDEQARERDVDIQYVDELLDIQAFADDQEMGTQERNNIQHEEDRDHVYWKEDTTAESPKTGSPLWSRDMGQKGERDKTKTGIGRCNEDRPQNIHQVVPNNINSRASSAGWYTALTGRIPTWNIYMQQRNGKRIHIDATLKPDGKSAIGIHYEDGDDLRIRITDKTKIHAAETYAAIKAIQIANTRQDNNITIRTDRLETVQMTEQRHRQGWTTNVEWEEGHNKNNKHNAVAHKLANEGANLTNVTEDISRYNNRTNKDWAKIRCGIRMTTCQLATGHGNMKHYLHKFKLTNNATCTCGIGDETTDHIKYHCTETDRQRAREHIRDKYSNFTINLRDQDGNKTEDINKLNEWAQLALRTEDMEEVQGTEKGVPLVVVSRIVSVLNTRGQLGYAERQEPRRVLQSTHVNTDGAMIALSRLMPNIGGPSPNKRRLLCSVARSILLYAAPAWGHSMNTAKHRNIHTRIQRQAALRICSAYRTTSTDAILVIAETPPMDLVLEQILQVARLCHVLQSCPTTHDSRIARHDDVVRRVVEHCRGKRYDVELEPHVRSGAGQLFKPDMAVHINGLTTVIADIQVSWDGAGRPLAVAYAEKKAKYATEGFLEGARKRASAEFRQGTNVRLCERCAQMGKYHPRGIRASGMEKSSDHPTPAINIRQSRSPLMTHPHGPWEFLPDVLSTTAVDIIKGDEAVGEVISCAFRLRLIRD
ncbi:hypothetical protein HUJ05_002176 [Dendroctonus ponderosae]|nr:hypothetical protein HUJ05_002176 [Dendroctonus ponderosae]